MKKILHTSGSTPKPSSGDKKGGGTSGGSGGSGGSGSLPKGRSLS